MIRKAAVVSLFSGHDIYVFFAVPYTDQVQDQKATRVLAAAATA